MILPPTTLVNDFSSVDLKEKFHIKVGEDFRKDLNGNDLSKLAPDRFLQ